MNVRRPAVSHGISHGLLSDPVEGHGYILWNRREVFVFRKDDNPLVVCGMATKVAKGRGQSQEFHSCWTQLI